MVNALFSPSWYRVADLQPRIRSHNTIHRHIYRGIVNYIVEDKSTGQIYRFNSMAYQVIGMMNGQWSIHTIWERMTESHGDEAPNQHEILELLGQLHSANILVCDVKPDVESLLLRHYKANRSSRQSSLQGNVLFMRIGLADPEKFLSITLGFVKFLFTVPFFVVFLSFLGLACLQAWLHWPELTTNIMDRVLTLENTLVLLIMYPIIKGLHELSHGYAVKNWGGEVHEMGIMLLLLMPLPYVDATSAGAFSSKWQRVIVNAAGIYMELILAVLAMLLWPLLEPGLLRTIAFNTLFIGGVSTLFFNGNPLVRFDGYFILSDILEMPNLGKRSLNFLGHLFNRYLFGIPNLVTSQTTTSEKIILGVYGISSFIYRLGLSVSILLFISGRFLIVGVVLALYGMYSMVVAPIVKKIHFMMTSSLYHDRRRRIFVIILSLLLLPLLVVTMVPLPYFGVKEGILSLPEDAHLRLTSNGVVESFVATPNTYVQKNDVLVHSQNALLDTQIAIYTSQLKEYRLRYKAVSPQDQMEAKSIKVHIHTLVQKVDRLQEQVRDLDLVSPTDGLFVVPEAKDLLGRYGHQGELIGYVLSRGNIVRVAVPQDDVDLIRNKTQAVELCSVSDISTLYRGHILRELPGATGLLPSSVLGTEGGGNILTDPNDNSGRAALEPLFQFDVQLEIPMDSLSVGKRVYVRFDYGHEPLFYRFFRTLRQLFLQRFTL